MFMEQQQLAGMELMEKKKSSSVHEGVDDQVLDLSGISLYSLPVIIKPSLNLGLVSTLDLSSNFLQRIPESLTAQLLNVVVLDVKSNELKSLPNSIGCLSKLKVLNVSGNLLQSLPRTIENCRSLEELNANFNMLKRLPDTIGYELINLKKLSVNANKLAFLPSSTSQLTNLRVLDAHLNCLSSLPDDLENLTNLEILNISQNFQHLSTIPYSTGLLLSLVELDVSYNNITTLPHSIGFLNKLQKLSVEGNPLVSPPSEVVEQGIQKVKVYLTQKMNGEHRKSAKKSWVGKLKRYSTFNRTNVVNLKHEEGLTTPSYNRIATLASTSMGTYSRQHYFFPKRILGVLSPQRFFSPKTY